MAVGLLERVRPGARVRVKVPTWFANRNDLASCEWEGEVKVVTHKAVLIHGHVSVRKTSTCLRCGRLIENPVSVYIGYGPICCEKLGIPRDFSKEEIVEIRKRLIDNTTRDLWVPKSVADIEILGDAPEAEETTEQEVEQEQAAKKHRVQISVHKGAIMVRSPYELKDVCKSIPGKWNPELRAWTYFADVFVAQEILQKFSQVAEIQTDQSFQPLMERVEQLKKAEEVAKAEDLPPIPQTKTEPWQHQVRGYWFAKTLPGCGLFFDMGTGKSKTVVDIVCNDRLNKVLIIAPKTVVDHWPGQFEMHGSCDIPVLALSTGGVSEKQVLAERFLRANKRGVIVINYESVWRDPFGPWSLSQEWDLAVLDESHRIKQHDGRASLFCAELGKRAKRRIILTGTPMPHSPLDVFAQYRFLDPSIFGDSFYRFRNRYAVMGGYQDKQIVGWRNLDELHRKMYSIALRVTTADVLDLPEAIHNVRYVELGPKASKIYVDFLVQFKTELEEGEISADNVLVRLLRLQQVTSGFLPLGKNEAKRIDTAKMDALRDLLEDVGDEPVVVFCRFQHDLDTVKEVADALGKKYGEVSGRRSDLVNAKYPENVNVLGVQIRAGGVGIDLTRARYAIYYSTGFSLGDYQQSLARIHRPGQTRTTYYYHLVARNTVDEKVYSALASKKEVVDYVLEDLREEMKREKKRRRD